MKPSIIKHARKPMLWFATKMWLGSVWFMDKAVDFHEWADHVTHQGNSNENHTGITHEWLDNVHEVHLGPPFRDYVIGHDEDYYDRVDDFYR